MLNYLAYSKKVDRKCFGCYVDRKLPKIVENIFDSSQFRVDSQSYIGNRSDAKLLFLKRGVGRTDVVSALSIKTRD